MAPRGPNDDEGVVDPEDLDITRNEKVNELRDGQYVIETGSGATDDLDLETIREELNVEPESTPPETDPQTMLADRLASLSVANGFTVAGRFDGDVDVTESASDDPATVFSDLLEWYAANVDDDTPEAEVLGILCLAGEVQINYPARAVVDAIRTHGLSPDDSIRDLLETIRHEGLTLPADDRQR